MFISDAAQYDWISKKIAGLIKNGTSPNEIAVLAPKHKYLISLLPYLAQQNVPVRYEKRENVLDRPQGKESRKQEAPQKAFFCFICLKIVTMGKIFISR